MTEHTWRDASLAFTLEQDEHQLRLRLQELSTGQTWGPVPLLRLEVCDKMQKRVDVIERYRIDEVEHLEDGVHVSLGDVFHAVRLGLWLRVRQGELAVRLQPAEVYEDDPALYRVMAIDLLPGLMTTTGQGSLILPLTSGVRCRPQNKPKLSDRFLIYGEQERWELLPTLPFCAVDNAAGGLMQMAVLGACDAECRVATDGCGAGTVGLGFSLRRAWPDPVDFDLREVRIIPIPAGQRADLFCAKRLRRHVMEDLGKPTLRQRAAESPEVAYLLDAYIMKLFYGIENVGIMMYGQERRSPMTFRRVMTFAEAKAGLQRLHAAGVDKILTESVGWIPRGHDGAYPTRFPIEERLGGEAGFRDLLAAGAALGYHMSVHDNYIDSYRVTPEWDLETTIHDIYGEPLVSGFWGGGINYRQWPLCFPYDRLEGAMRRVRDLGVRGMYYCDGMANPLEINYHPRHRGPRSGHAQGIVRILETARRVAGAAGTECGFLYGAVPADCMVMCGWGWDLRRTKPEWTVSALWDQQLPIWQLAMHGLIILEGHGENWTGTMRKILFGNHPRTEWSAQPGIMPVLDDQLIGFLKAEHDLVLKRFGYLQLLEMTNYEEPAPNVAMTRFEDGTEIVADFARKELTVNGKAVPRPAPIGD